jgi:hypothetical protein
LRNLSLLAVSLIFCAGSCLSQTLDRADASAGMESPSPSPSPAANSGSPKFGIAVSASTLGAGIQAATAVSRTDNLRVGFNYFTYSHDFNKDGIAYNGTLNLRSAEVLFDQYFGNIFHISPGLMFYDGNKGTANAGVPGGQSFTLGGVTYYSDSASPVNGTGHITARKAAPEFLIGFGNLLPRSNKHFTANFELGVVLQGSPSATLQLNGNTCTGPGSQCQSIASNPAAQASVLSEQNKINSSLSVFKYYPVVRLSFGYKF